MKHDDETLRNRETKFALQSSHCKVCTANTDGAVSDCANTTPRSSKWKPLAQGLTGKLINDQNDQLESPLFFQKNLSLAKSGA